MRLEVTPKNLFGALGGIVMTATSGPEETQSQSLDVFGLAQIAPQGIAHQGCNWNLFPLGEKLQLTSRGFVQKDTCTFHMTYAYGSIHRPRATYTEFPVPFWDLAAE